MYPLVNATDVDRFKLFDTLFIFDGIGVIEMCLSTSRDHINAAIDVGLLKGIGGIPNAEYILRFLVIDTAYQSLIDLKYWK